MKKISNSLLVGLVLLSVISQKLVAQDVAKPDTSKTKFINWFNTDYQQDNKLGVSTEKAYSTFLKGKTSVPVIVAVIDGGVDIYHEDLQGKIWINPKEIAGNGIDDDQNGYIDDIHGWNFIGNANGKNLVNDNLEITRIIRDKKAKFDGKKASEIASNDKKEYDLYKRAKNEYDKEWKKASEEKEIITNISANYEFAEETLKNYFNKDNFTFEEIKEIETKNEIINSCKSFMISVTENGLTKETLDEWKNHNNNKLEYQLNPNLNARSIVGDDIKNLTEKHYGNNDVKGERSGHGSHVAGIIASNRNNGIGLDGIVENVQIMVLRVVPDGDEYDKDVANAIIYAADNGARVINMSFGKSYSPNKEIVDNAIKYADSKDVLMIHAAGNDGQDNDIAYNFPKPVFEDGTKAKNWLEIAASSMFSNEKMTGIFTNYGKKSVDLFAPGVDIYSLKPENQYSVSSGTSMACPVVSGIAALVMSYYPNLTASQVKDILIKSSIKYPKQNVYLPNENNILDKKVKFKKLSKTAGIANAYEAIKLAEATYKK